MSAIQPARPTPADPDSPIIHPMDPRRGEKLSPRFAAVLCFLLDLPPATQPAVTGLHVSSGGCVLLATTRDPSLNTVLGSWADLERNLRRWGAACGAGAEVVEQIIARARRRWHE